MQYLGSQIKFFRSSAIIFGCLLALGTSPVASAQVSVSCPDLDEVCYKSDTLPPDSSYQTTSDTCTWSGSPGKCYRRVGPLPQATTSSSTGVLNKQQCESVSGRTCSNAPVNGSVCQPGDSSCAQCCRATALTNTGSTGSGASSGSGSSGTSTGTSIGACPSGGFQKIAGVCVPTSSATGGLSDRPVVDIIAGFASTLLEIFGILALIAFIVSGFQYLMAAGDEKDAETAKKNLKYSVIAIIIALGGVIIINAIDSILNTQTIF